MDDLDIPEGAIVRTVRRGSAEGADCASCPFAKHGQPNVPVLAEGPAEDPAWIIVAEGPSHADVAQGRPAVGQVGGILTKALTHNRRDRSTVWLTQATLCAARPGSDVATKLKAARACLPRLQRELAAMAPVPVLALGAVAARALLPTKLQGITELADTWHAADVDGTGRIRDVIPSIHPAAILHGGGEVKSAHAAELGFWNLLFSVSKVESLARGKDIRFDFSGVRTEICDPRRADQLIVEIYQRALREGSIGLDLETYVEDEERHEAKQPYVAKIRVLGLATEGFAISVLWKLLSPNSIRLVGLILRNPKVRKIGQNAISFDRTVFRALGFDVDEAWDDTMLMHHAAFPGMGHKLQTVVSQFYAVEPWKSDYRASGDSDEDVTVYNAKDTLTCRAVTAPLTVWIKRREVENVYELDRQCAFIASEMHLHGIPVSHEVNQEIAVVLKEVIDRSLAEMRAAVDERRDEIWVRLATQQANTKRKADADAARDRFAARMSEIENTACKKGWQFNPDANLQVIALLQSLGCVLRKRSKSGKQASTDAEVLEQYKHLPLVRDLIAYRERDKLLGTFVLPMFDRTDEKGRFVPGYVEPSGRAHPQWSVHAITGRWRAENPMTQNFSKGDPMRCPDCMTWVLPVGVDAYFHPPGKKSCDRTNTCLPRSTVLIEGVPNLRAQVVAPRGRRFVGFDAAQQEARILALLSDDPFLCSIFSQGKDIHNEFAAVVWPGFWDMPSDQRKALREGVKNAEYASFYGGSEETVHKTLVVKLNDPSITLQQTRQMIGLMRSRMSRLIAWQAQMLQAVSKPPHEIRTHLLGRLRAFPLAMFSPADIANFPVQSFGAYMIKRALVRMMPKLRAYKRPCFPILDVHDAVIFECDENDVDRLKQDVESEFAQIHKTRSGVEIPFPIETKDGASWAEV